MDCCIYFLGVGGVGYLFGVDCLDWFVGGDDVVDLFG